MLVAEGTLDSERSEGSSIFAVNEYALTQAFTQSSPIQTLKATNARKGD